MQSNNIWREYKRVLHNLTKYTNYVSQGLEVRMDHGTNNEPSLLESTGLF